MNAEDTDATNKTGVLLVNLGSPEAPTRSAVRKFLGEFLGDPRVVNLPRWLWWIILNCFVLTFRPGKSAKAYQAIWTDQGSPLTAFTRQLTEKVANRFQSSGIQVDYAMRYGQPSVEKRLRTFQKSGVNQIVILPLYPQYSSTTTASVYDAVVTELNRWRYLPTISFIGDYHRDTGYISAVVDAICQFWQSHGQAELLLMSFHGLPEKLTELGDPYAQQCKATAALIANQLGLNEQQWKLVFQSRFGKAEWLKPYCVETLKQLPTQGIRNVDVVCPGFSVDCLETLEEIELANQEIFMESGGQSYRYIPALNASDRHVQVMVDLINAKL